MIPDAGRPQRPIVPRTLRWQAMPYALTPASAAKHPQPEWQWLPRDPAMTPEQQARAWLAPRLGCVPDLVPLQRTQYGRPRLLAPYAQDDISWSHSGQGLLIAHARDAFVGIDLEYERPRKQVVALAKRYFHPDEASWIEAGTDAAARQTAFIRLWCAKEAVLKAHGRGLAFGLDRLQFIERDATLHLHACDAALGLATHWRLRELMPQAGYLGALAWYPGILPA